jgi:hypothetical protein
MNCQPDRHQAPGGASATGADESPSAALCDDNGSEEVEAVLRSGRAPIRLDGGRSWWAHFEFTRINIDAPTILPKKIEDLREVGASKSIDRCTNQMTTFCSLPTLRRSARSDEAPITRLNNVGLI